MLFDKQLLMAAGIVCLLACEKKQNSCHDPALEEQFKNLACTADCPVVTACNGYTYCNECEANKRGYRLK